MAYADDHRSPWYGLSLVPVTPPDRLSRLEKLFDYSRSYPRAFQRWQTWIALLGWLVCQDAGRYIAHDAGFESPFRWLAGLLLVFVGFVPFAVIVATARAASLWKEVLERENR